MCNRFGVRLLRLPTLLLIASIATACGGRQRVVLGPLPADGNAEARGRFVNSQAKFEQSGEDVSRELEILIREFPNDPVVPYALLYAGMSAVRAGQYQRALDKLRQIDNYQTEPAVRARGKLYEGLALNYLGRHSDALGLLRAAESAVNPDDPDERGEWLAAMAEASQRVGQKGDAIRYYDAWYSIASPAEQKYAVSQIKALAGELSPGELAPVFDSLVGRSGPGAAFVGDKLASQYAARGDLERAQSIRETIGDAREALGLSPYAAPGAAESGRLGALLPLSGRKNRVGDRSMRGLTLGAKLLGPAEGQPFQLVVRDSVGGASQAPAAVEELASEDVIAVVGPMDSQAVRSAGQEASRNGVPIISLSPRGSAAADPSRYLFHIVHSAEARARALARYARNEGISDFAILAPANAYGRAVGRAFAREVQKLGGRVVVQTTYDTRATAFTDVVARLRKPWRAIFIPDQARRLSLVAPALAAANFQAAPAGARQKSGGPRNMLLLSTAELVDERYLRSTGRYSFGAVLAPGFYPDRQDSLIGPFVSRYESEYGSTPTALEAYAYDAARLVSAAIRGGAYSRSDLADRMGDTAIDGLTGKIRFDAVHERADGGLLFRVERADTGAYELRAQR